MRARLTGDCKINLNGQMSNTERLNLDEFGTWHSALLTRKAFQETVTRRLASAVVPRDASMCVGGYVLRLSRTILPSFQARHYDDAHANRQLTHVCGGARDRSRSGESRNAGSRLRAGDDRCERRDRHVAVRGTALAIDRPEPGRPIAGRGGQRKPTARVLLWRNRWRGMEDDGRRTDVAAGLRCHIQEFVGGRCRGRGVESRCRLCRHG